MSHLNTQRDREMVFEMSEFWRLCAPYIISLLIIALSAFMMVMMIFDRQFINGRTSYLLGFEALIFVLGSVVALSLQPALVHRRRIANAMMGLVYVLERQLKNLATDENFAFGVQKVGYINVARKGKGSWLVQVYAPGDSLTDAPMFETVMTENRMAQVDNPDLPIAYSRYTLLLVNRVREAVAAQCELSALVTMMNTMRVDGQIRDLETRAVSTPE